MRRFETVRETDEMTAPVPPGGIMPPAEGLFSIVWRRQGLVIAVVLAALAGGLGYLYKATPIYSSTSRLYVEQTGPKIMTEQEGVMTQSKNYLYTQCGLLTSTPILSEAAEKPEISKLKTFEEVDNRIAWLKKNIDASVGKKDDILSVTLESPYPKEAAQVVNAIVDSYITYHSTQKRSTASEVLKILQKEKSKRDQELSGRLEAILKFKEENSALSLEDENGNILIQGLSRLMDALTESRIETINAKADYEAAQTMMNDPVKLKQMMESQRSGGVYVSTSSPGQVLDQQLLEMRLTLTALEKKLTPEHAVIQQMKEKIRQVEEQQNQLQQKSGEAYLEVVRQRWLTCQQRETELQNAVETKRNEAQQLSTKAAHLAILQTELKRTENLCDILDSRIKELNVTEDTGALNISILEVARAADGPSKPQRSRIMAMALVLGLMAGVGLALVLDMMDHRLRSAEEISSIVGVPVLGTVPTIKGGKDVGSFGRIVSREPLSVTAEAYKTIRTAVYFGVPGGKAKTILITSPAPGDGKSTLVSNLASAMAQAGHRTLIMDCDFRKPRQHAIFEKEQEPGLSNVLSGQMPMTAAIQSTDEKNLDILCSGPVPVNPSELLNSEAFRAILEKLSEPYDRILIDSPPVMPVADARIVSANCDITLMVLRAEKSTRKASEEARDGLLSVGATILGVVVNDVNPKRGRYGYYRGGYGYYGHYGYGAYGRSGQEKHEILEDKRTTSMESKETVRQV